MAPDQDSETALAPTVERSKELTVREDYDESFDDLVLEVQLEHELAGFETIATPRIDKQIEGQLGEEVTKTAMILVCHAEIGKEAIEMDPRVAGLFPCTTVVYEDADDGSWNVYHASAMQATKDLSIFPDDEATMQTLVEMTEERMGPVWEEIEARFGT